jgi:oxygen-independent coproporphyrinogen-3 oxidase
MNFSEQPAYEHVYVHVPFCARRCSYCDFSIAVRREVPWQEYVDGIRGELALQLADARPAVRTLYFGGGTPSRLGVDGVRALVGLMRERFSWDDDAEVTLEANPEDISVESVRAWREAGINRLSIGVQSFHDDVLRWMHRVHDADAAKRAVGAARNGGIVDHSIDLIFATPDGVPRSWTYDLEQAIALGANHVSLYGLTVEPHTPLGRWNARGTITEADEERYEREFLEAHDRLGAAGYEHYEVSNYARPGRRARHNSAYWRAVPYLGLGPSAHGFDGTRRRWNEPAYAAWLRHVNEGRDPMTGAEVLTHENRTAESVYLGLRTLDGLSISATEAAHATPWADAGWATIQPAHLEGRDMQIDGDVSVLHAPTTPRLTCTPMGWLRLDALAADLTAFRSAS